jgi:DHA1 family bicyclomycin/chloramphenicol resistance-like MFS transporter
MHTCLTLILAGLTMIGPLAIDTYLPSFLAIGRDFRISALALQQTLSAFLATFAFMMLFYGTLSDSFGRRPVILVSLALYCVASFGAAVAPSFGWLMVCRVLQGLAAGAGSVVGRAIVQDRASGAEAQKMMAQIMMVFGLAPAIAPVLGGWLQVAFGWRSVFVFLGGFGATMILICYCWLPESLPQRARQPFHPGPIAANYWKVLRDRKFVFLALALGTAFSAFALYIGSAANFVMNILHLPETAFAWMFIPLVGGLVLGSAVSARLAVRFGPRRFVRAGYVVMCAASAASVCYNYYFVAAVPWAVLPLALYAFGMALASPALTVMTLSLFPHNRGLVSSLQSSIQMLLFALVSGLIAPLLFDSALKLACGMAAGVTLSMLCWTLGRPR